MNTFIPLKNYEELYVINKLGEILDIKRNNKVTLTLGDGGYLRVKLRKDNKQKTIHLHILLAKTFIEDYDPKYQTVDHINRNKLDNKLSNLRVVSIRDNMNNRVDNSIYGVGVYKHGRRFSPIIKLNKKAIRIGYYSTSKEASDKYLEVKSALELVEKQTKNYTYEKVKISKSNYSIIFTPILN